MSTQRPVLIVDGLNCFCRAYAAYPSMNVDGEQVGGIVGFMKTVQRLTLEFQPTVVYVAWESGGSLRRRSLLKEYKANRRPGRLNRFYEDDIPDSDENKLRQVTVLLNVLKCAPLCQLYVPDCEADDVIAYLCKGALGERVKVIVSSDKDFYQLLDERTSVYSLHKKEIVSMGDVLETFRVTSRNFAIAKSLCGDVSDNVPGVKGLGFRTVAKKFPMLGTESDVVLDDVFSYCHTHIDESSIYRRVLEHEQDVRRNWRLVHLGSSSLSSQQASKVDESLVTFEPRSNKLEMIKRLIRVGITDFDVSAFFGAFVGVDGYTR